MECDVIRGPCNVIGVMSFGASRGVSDGAGDWFCLLVLMYHTTGGMTNHPPCLRLMFPSSLILPPLPPSLALFPCCRPLSPLSPLSPLFLSVSLSLFIFPLSYLSLCRSLSLSLSRPSLLSLTSLSLPSPI